MQKVFQIWFSFLFSLLVFGCSVSSVSISGPKDARQVVVSYHPLATHIGEQILDEGGNAFDAFVATTAAQYVLSEGVTSLGGPLGALLFDAKSKSAFYMDAEFNDPLNIEPVSQQPGDAALVPGAIAGLEAISVSYGKLPFKKVLEPAIKLAQDGFVLNRIFASVLANPVYQSILKRSDYGADTFYQSGKPLREGDTLKLPVLANFLQKISNEGSAYAYKGEWAKKFVKAVASQGGHLTLKDLSDYKVIWWSAPRIHYRDFDIYATSGRAYGGLNNLLALKVLEHADLKKYGNHFSKSAEALELLIRIENEVKAETWLKDPTKLDNAKSVEKGLSQENADAIWLKVQKQTKAKSPLFASKEVGSHSYQVVVIDKDGNAITGTNTIESMPWAQGIFVDGVALTGARALKYYSTRPGDRRLSPFAMEIGVKKDHVEFASGAFSSSLIAAAFEFVVNIVDYNLSAREVTSLPRFGEDAWNLNMSAYKYSGGLWLDPRVDKNIVKTLSDHNMKVIQSGIVDTGLGSVAIVGKDGRMDKGIAPLSGLDPSVKKDYIGVGLILEAKSNSLFVKQILPNSEAASSKKIEVGDELISIQATRESNWTLTSGLKVEEAVRQMRGAEGTKLSLLSS